MNSFSAEDKQTHTQVIFNLTSQAATAAVVYENSVGKHVIWHDDVPFSTQDFHDDKHRKQVLTRALTELVDRFSQTGRDSLRQVTADAKVDEVAVFFSAPWQAEDTLTSRDREINALPFTDDRLEKLRNQAHFDFIDGSDSGKSSTDFHNLHERIVGAYADREPIEFPHEGYLREAAVTFHISKLGGDIFDLVNRALRTQFPQGLLNFHSYNDFVLQNLSRKRRRKRQFLVRVHDHQTDVFVLTEGRVISSATAPVGEQFLRDALRAADPKASLSAESHLELKQNGKHHKEKNHRSEIAVEEVRQAFGELIAGALESAPTSGGVTHVHVLTPSTRAGRMFLSFVQSSVKGDSLVVNSLNDAAEKLSGMGGDNRRLDPELALGILNYKQVS